MHSNNPFIQAQFNIKFLIGAKSAREYNEYFFRFLNINNKQMVFFLNLFAPLIYLFNILGTLLLITVRFCLSLLFYRWKINESEYKDFDRIFLFFSGHFPDRCKAANVYEQSKYWVVSPAMDEQKYNLPGKTIVDYRKYLTKFDGIKIFWSSILFIVEYSIKVRHLCLIHKIWDYYEVDYSLRRIGQNSIFYFSNQSDKYALLFDQLKSKEKVLLQHGIVVDWEKLPYRLNNITEFHAMSKLTWKDAYENLLTNKPKLVIMKPTIVLFDTPRDKFNILIVAYIQNIDIEKIILEKLAGDKTVAIYLKKHPSLVNDNCYIELQEKYGFNYITDKKFPRVDFVISYQSTLAYEYMAYGIPVYMYKDKKDFRIVDMLVLLESYMRN